MRTGLKKKQKETVFFFNEADPMAEIKTYNTDLKNRLTCFYNSLFTGARLLDIRQGIPSSMINEGGSPSIFPHPPGRRHTAGSLPG